MAFNRKAKLRDNIEAIRTAFELGKAGRAATPQEGAARPLLRFRGTEMYPQSRRLADRCRPVGEIRPRPVPADDGAAPSDP